MSVQMKALITFQIVLMCCYVSQTDAWADFTVATNVKKTICTKNMACRWAICPWNARLIMPSSPHCLMVDNEGCSCPAKHTCRLSDTVDPTVATIQYEYRCMAGTDEPFTKNYFDIRRKRRQANIFDRLNSRFSADWDPK